jgi:hypothetical protein
MRGVFIECNNFKHESLMLSPLWMCVCMCVCTLILNVYPSSYARNFHCFHFVLFCRIINNIDVQQGCLSVYGYLLKYCCHIIVWIKKRRSTKIEMPRGEYLYVHDFAASFFHIFLIKNTKPPSIERGAFCIYVCMMEQSKSEISATSK